MANNIFSSEFISSAGEQYKVDLFSESYIGFDQPIIGGSGNVFYFDKDWTDFFDIPMSVTIFWNNRANNALATVSSITYNAAQDRTELTLSTAHNATYEEVATTLYRPTFSPTIIDVHTEWEAADDIILDSIKASNTVITYANKDAWFDRFMDLYLESNDNELKLIIYKDNSGWELEWVGNIVVDLLEWDNAPKPIPITIKAIDGLDKLKDIPYDESLTSPDDRPLNEHISNLLEKNDLSQFWGTLDPYLRESIEYKSNEVSGTLTDAHSPLDYSYLNDKIFHNKEQNEDDTPITCYDALRAILELFNCRMFISKGVYYIQQARNYNGAAPTINYREYTKSLSTYTSAIYGSKLSAGNTGTEDLSVLAGGKFGYLAGLYKASMDIMAFDQSKVIVEREKQIVGNVVAGDNPLLISENLGEVDGGFGSTVKLSTYILKHIDYKTNDRCDVKILLYQGGTSGLHSRVTGGSGADVIVDSFVENFDLATRCSSSSQLDVYDSSKTFIKTVNILSISQSGTALTIETDDTYASNWAYVQTNDYSTTYFARGSVNSRLVWVTMEYMSGLYARVYGNRILSAETDDIPFDGTLMLAAEYTHFGSSGVNKKWWEVKWVEAMFPTDGVDNYSRITESLNPNTDLYTKEIKLPPIIINDINKSSSLVGLQVKSDYLTTNNTLVKSDTWDASFNPDLTLVDTRVAEAMSLQYKAVERYMGGFVGQYYPHNTIDYEAHNQNNYYFHAFRKHYLMDEVDGEWFESINQDTNVSTTVHDSDTDDLPDETGGGVGDALVALIDDSDVITDTDTDISAGVITSIPINAIGSTRLYDGDTIELVEKESNNVIGEFQVSADVSSSATSISVTSKLLEQDCFLGTYVRLKPSTHKDLQKIRADVFQHKGNSSVPVVVTDMKDKEMIIVGGDIYIRNGTVVTKLTGTTFLSGV